MKDANLKSASTSGATKPLFTRRELLELGPYRIFFPLGLLSGLLGVGHWVLWSIGWVKEASKQFHIVLQVEGFLGMFVVGFVMTAIPRFLGASSARLWEIGLAFVCGGLVILLPLAGKSSSAQIPFLCLLVLTVIFVGRRLPHKTKAPPPSFLLVGFGFLHALLGSSLYYGGQIKNDTRWMDVGQQTLEMGFVLCLVLGIAGYLLPFLSGYAGDPATSPAHAGLRKASRTAFALHGGTGLAILASFFFPEDAAKGGALLRAVAATAHFMSFGQLYHPIRKKGAHILFFWISCWLVLVGLWASALWPEYHIALDHIVFIGGFSLLIFSFGSLVVLSHSAQAALLTGRLWVLKVTGSLVLAAGLVRVLADFDAWRYKFWIHIASGLWWVAALVWLIYILPKLWRIPAVDFEHRPDQ